MIILGPKTGKVGPSDPKRGDRRCPLGAVFPRVATLGESGSLLAAPFHLHDLLTVLFRWQEWANGRNGDLPAGQKSKTKAAQQKHTRARATPSLDQQKRLGLDTDRPDSNS